MEVHEKFPLSADLLPVKRYRDNLGDSMINEEKTDSIIKETTRVLRAVNMKVKGWAKSGVNPPEELSENGVSLSFAGMVWFPRLDVYKLNIDSLHFGKKRRGRYPPDMVKYEDTVGLTVDQFTPENITGTICMSVVARIYDIQGLLAPLMLKFKNDLRNLIKVQPYWTESIPLSHRAIWVNNFKTIKDLRDLMYIRCTIPSDAVRRMARLLHLTDAGIGVMLGI